mgnify:CR=1 FL=1
MMLCRRRRGFTLIELLVVIAIIAILAAMLFPVFARARESARKIQCLANVKNIATAIQMYLVDYDRLPPCELNQAAKDYFANGPGRGSPSSCCNRAPQANPFLRWPVILDEYTKNRDVWRCPSSGMWVGVEWIVPDYGRGYLAYLQATEGEWGRRDPECGGGPCCLAFPPGWGGAITDSIAQHSHAGQDNNAIEITISTPNLYNVKTSQIGDPAWLVVCGDSTVHENILGPSGILYELCRTNDCACGDWSDGQDCTLDPNYLDQWRTDAGFRRQFTRHLGGSNVGFADGHASWWAAEALETAAPYCECCSDETGYSGSTIHTEGRQIRGLCPVGVG